MVCCVVTVMLSIGMVDVEGGVCSVCCTLWYASVIEMVCVCVHAVGCDVQVSCNTIGVLYMVCRYCILRRDMSYAMWCTEMVVWCAVFYATFSKFHVPEVLQTLTEM